MTAADPTTAQPATPGLDLDAFEQRGREGWPTSHDVQELVAEVRRLRDGLDATRTPNAREDVAYLVYRAVDIGDPSRAAALEVADQILTRLGAGPLSSVPPAGTEADQ